MGYLRFRKTISILPGIKLNLSKTGVSASVGGKGSTMNIGTRRRMVTLGIPGTGLSYQMSLTGTVALAIVVIGLVVGVAYLIKPELVRQALHWWQPQWF